MSLSLDYYFKSSLWQNKETEFYALLYKIKIKYF